MIKNMTPHEIVLCDRDGVAIKTFPSEGLVRLKATTVSAGEVNGFPLTKTVFGEPEGLPEEKGYQWYIVSQLVKTALPHRRDLLVPAEMVRDSEGKILGCQSFGV